MSRTNSKKVQEAEIVQEVVKNPTGNKEKKAKKTQWGLALILIIIGAVLILDSFKIATFNFNFWSLIRLWPLILISAGLGVLGERNKTLNAISTFGNVLIVIFALLVVNGIIPLDFNKTGSEAASDGLTVGQEIKQADIAIKSSGKLKIGAHDDSETIKHRGTSLEIKRVTNGSREEIEIEPRSAIDFLDSQTDITLTKALPIKLDLNFGAGKAEADLRELNITELEISSGASDLVIKIDSTASRNLDINLNLGASNATLYVPKTVGVRLVSKSGLSSVKTNGLEQRGENTYETPDLSSLSTTYDITLKSGVTNFELKYL